MTNFVWVIYVTSHGIVDSIYEGTPANIPKGIMYSPHGKQGTGNVQGKFFGNSQIQTVCEVFHPLDALLADLLHRHLKSSNFLGKFRIGTLVFFTYANLPNSLILYSL